MRATKAAKDGATPDGVPAHQLCIVPSAAERALSPGVRHRRDELERALSALRARKGRTSEDASLAKLEPLPVELARLCADTAAARQP